MNHQFHRIQTPSRHSPSHETAPAPAFAVLVSTAGTVWGCHAAGMTNTEVTIAGALAFPLSFAAAFVAVLLASRPRGLPRDPAS